MLGPSHIFIKRTLIKPKHSDQGMVVLQDLADRQWDEKHEHENNQIPRYELWPEGRNIYLVTPYPIGGYKFIYIYLFIFMVLSLMFVDYNHPDTASNLGFLIIILFTFIIGVAGMIFRHRQRASSQHKFYLSILEDRFG